MPLSIEDVKRIAFLARLHIPDEQLEYTKKELEHILTFINQLNEIDTSKTQPLTGVCLEQMPMRSDSITDGNYIEAVLHNAPEKLANMFVVPKVVE